MENIIPFVSIFSLTSLTLNSAVKTHFKALQGVVEPMANLKIIAAFKRNKNLKDYLVHASLGSTKKDKLDNLYKRVKFIRNVHTDQGAPVWQALGLESSNLVPVGQKNRD